jgi:hypothetical protein
MRKFVPYQIIYTYIFYLKIWCMERQPLDGINTKQFEKYKSVL